MVFLLTAAGVAAVGLARLYPFLAVTHRVPAETLVVDGWMPTYDLVKAAAEYRSGGYRRLLVVRAAYEFESIDRDPGNRGYISQVFIGQGIPKDRLSVIVFSGVKKDRTYASAIAVRDWCAAHGVRAEALDLATMGPHARRSRFLYRKALGRNVSVGVISLDDPAYDQRHWWRFSEGVREVLFEGVAYLYARFLFFPAYLG